MNILPDIDTSLTLDFTSSAHSSTILFISPEELNSVLNERKKSVFIIDRNLFRLYERMIKALLAENGAENPSPFLLLQAKEANKDCSTLRSIIDFFILHRVTRNDNIVAIGGGITLDITAFAASIYKRGCYLTLIPTTFLAMIDAAVGGKTGINYQNYKNILGSFYPADSIFIAPQFLYSLPEVEIKNGWAECIKIALLYSTKLYGLIMKDSSEITADIIRESILGKYHFSCQDLTDSGVRQKLNLGHTFAHLIESATDYQIPHGLAVAIGIRAAVELSLKRGLITKATMRRIIEPLEFLKLPNSLESKYHDRIRQKGEKLLGMDKKNRHTGQVILFTGFQKTVISSFSDPAELIETLLALGH